MIITINPELVKPLQDTAKKLGTLVEIQESEHDGQLQVLLPEEWSGTHWFEFGFQAGLDLQFRTSITIND